nr:TniB family NTP-binding protein [Rhizobium leguminosarum]
MTGYSHLQPAYREYADLTVDERIAWIRADRWLETANEHLALGRLNDLLTYPDRMPCLLIYGATGMGKTKIIRKFLRDHAPTSIAALGPCRWWRCRCPPNRWSVTSMANFSMQ